MDGELWGERQSPSPTERAPRSLTRGGRCRGREPLVILRQMTHMFELKMLIRGLSGDQVRVRGFLTCRMSCS